MRGVRCFSRLEAERDNSYLNSLRLGRHDGRTQSMLAYGPERNGGGASQQRAITLELYNETNGEHVGVFAKIEPLLAGIRSTAGPQFPAMQKQLGLN